MSLPHCYIPSVLPYENTLTLTLVTKIFVTTTNIGYWDTDCYVTMRRKQSVFTIWELYNAMAFPNIFTRNLLTIILIHSK
jgi:hypothetical protein